MVDSSLVTEASCTNGPETDQGNAVYIYSGSAVAVDDYGSATEPLASAAVTQSQSGAYTYTIGFLAAGTYTVAFTCQRSDDDPEADDDIALVGAADVDIVANSATGFDF